jgi:hypothetical protein
MATVKLVVHHEAERAISRQASEACIALTTNTMKTDPISAASIALGILLSIGGCSRTHQDAAPVEPSLGESTSSKAEPSTLYDPSNLAEVQSLSELPVELRHLLQPIADVGEPFNNTDVLDSRRPSRRFRVGGISDTSALVAYDQGGFAPVTIAAAFVHVKSRWTVVRRWTIGSPTKLRELREMTSISPND